MTSNIDIKCPKCSNKASFFSDKEIKQRFIIRSCEGKAVCLKCGFNKKHSFSEKDYYYAIPIKDRILYGRNIKNLVELKKHFKENLKIWEDPELDYPKVFYQNKDEIITQIDKILKKENSN